MINMRQAAAALILAAGTSATAGGEEFDELSSFLVGQYALIGQHPDSGATYSGTAEIKLHGKTLVLLRRSMSATFEAKGRIERASPGEGIVVRFAWSGHDMTCLPSSDLDNYYRLSCFWTKNGAVHKAPGLESYFPTATWPK